MTILIDPWRRYALNGLALLVGYHFFSYYIFRFRREQEKPYNTRGVSIVNLVLEFRTFFGSVYAGNNTSFLGYFGALLVRDFFTEFFLTIYYWLYIRSNYWIWDFSFGKECLERASLHRSWAIVLWFSIFIIIFSFFFFFRISWMVTGDRCYRSIIIQ